MTADLAEALEPGRTDDVVLAERAVLASMIAHRDAAEQVLEVLIRDDCFGEGMHRAVYAAVRYLTEAGELNERGDLTGDKTADGSVQGRFAAVLARLAAAEQGVWRTGQAGVILGGLMRYATAAYMADAATVLGAARQRWTLEALDAARDTVSRPGWDADADAELVRKVIEDAMCAGPETSTATTAADLFLHAVSRLESGEPPGIIEFPWQDLRDVIPWLRPGQLVSILARPSLGKSNLGLDVARYNAIRRRIPAVLFTMEMDRDEVMDRLISAESGVLHKRIVECDLDEEAWDRIAAARERFEESRLVIDDTPKATIAHIRARLRGMARQGPAQLAIVDYLQLMGAPSGENRQQEVAALVGDLKAIAREFRIPVIMLCQLNRGPENRHDKRPYLSDARESGSVDNDSDIAILIHRPDFYEPESVRAGEADLIIDKNRNGPRKTVTVGFQGHYARFVDLAWTAHTAAMKAA